MSQSSQQIALGSIFILNALTSTHQPPTPLQIQENLHENSMKSIFLKCKW